MHNAVSRTQHAANCINMGLEMIDVIRHVERRPNACQSHGEWWSGRVSRAFGSIVFRTPLIDLFRNETVFFRRVHITRATLDHLGDKFEVEPGNGGSRDGFLADHKTFLIKSEC